MIYSIYSLDLCRVMCRYVPSMMTPFRVSDAAKRDFSSSYTVNRAELVS